MKNLFKTMVFLVFKTMYNKYVFPKQYLKYKTAISRLNSILLHGC